MVYTCACPVAKVSHELDSKRKRNSGSSTTVTLEILNHFIKQEEGKEKQKHNDSGI
jgi:hypothetical protein